MRIAQTIQPQAWMTAPPAKAVMAALNAAASEPQALFVGGCIRCVIMKKEMTDIDIATRHQPGDVIRILTQAGIRTIPTGIDHGTVTAVADGQSFEITTLRRDVKTDGRHAVVAFTDDWAEDAARRDFTMNTLLGDEKGNIYDPAGQGLADLKAGRVVFVGDAQKRIAEDYLRILRFFRFYAWYGTGEPDAAAFAACRKAADKIGTLSKERITQEFLKIIAADKAALVLDLMFGGGIMAGLPDGDFDPAVLERLTRLQKKHGLPGVMTRLAVLGKDVSRFENYLVLSNEQKKIFADTLAGFADLQDIDSSGVKTLIYRHGAERAGQVLLLRAALNKEVPAGLDLVKEWNPPAFPVSGADIMAAGIAQGPEVGRALSRIEEWWIAQDMHPSREECLRRIKES